MKRQQAGVVVVGGGWAGLAAAVELASHGRPVTLFESARLLGGRARCVRFGADRVDNGQHLMIGAYRAMLGMLETIGLDADAVFLRQPLHLLLRSPASGDVRLEAPRLPAPLHLLTALLTARGLSLNDKWQTLRFWAGRMREGFDVPGDVSVSELFRRCRQPDRVVQALWDPLCVAILNTPPGEASARLFLRVLDEAFNKAGGHADLLLPRADLGATLPEPAARFIENRGGTIHLGRRVDALDVGPEGVRGVNAGGASISASQVILATPPHIARRLLSGHEGLRDLHRGLACLRSEPIVTVYLRYDDGVRLPEPLIGCLDGLAQWVFDRRVCGQPGLMAVVISGEGPHARIDHVTLTRLVTRELAGLFPHWPAPEESLVIRERRATLASEVGIEGRRPAHATPVPGLWLAGDYTDTGLPATLEGAIRSGQACARHVMTTELA